MKKILLLLVGIGFSAIPYVNIPIRINNQSPPQVVSIDINNDSVKYRVDHIIDTTNKLRDTVNYYLYGIGGYTGTGKQVRQASPTLTGTANVASMVFSGTLTTSALSASQAIFTDGSKNLVSNALTGSGSVVMSVSPTISSPNMSSASITTATLNGTITNNGTISGGTGNFTTLQQGGVQAVTTSGTQTLTNKSISANQITTGTFGTGNYGIAGDLTFSNPSNAAGTYRGISGVIADNDYWYVGGRVGSGSNDGQLYIGTRDDGNEPIVFGTGDPGSPTQWANIQTIGVTSINGVFSNSGQIRANNSGGQGTYLELAKYQGSLPGFPSGYYPTLKTDWDAIHFAGASKYLASIANNGTYNSFSVISSGGGSSDVVLQTDGQSSYIRTGKLGIGNNSPDSTLTVTGSTRVTGNTRIEGNFSSNAFRSLDGSAYFDTTISFTWSGFTTGGLGKLRFIKIGNLVTMQIDTIMGGNGATGQGVEKASIVPTALRPSHRVEIPLSNNNCIENSGFGTSFFGEVDATGKVVLTPFYNDYTVGDAWVDGGTRGLDCRVSVSWMIN